MKQRHDCDDPKQAIGLATGVSMLGLAYRLLIMLDLSISTTGTRKPILTGFGSHS